MISISLTLLCPTVEESLSPFLQLWDKLSESWTNVYDLGYTRYGFNNIASPVPLDSGIEDWCLTSDEMEQYPETPQDEEEIDFDKAGRLRPF